MSKLLDQADAIAAHLTANVPELAGVDVVVDRQKDLGNEVKQAVGKAKGAVVIVSAASGRNTTPGNKVLSFSSVLSVAVVSKPAKRKGQTLAMDIVEALMKSLHHHKTDLAKHCNKRVEVLSWKLLPSPTYLIYEIQASIPTTIPTTIPTS